MAGENSVAANTWDISTYLTDTRGTDDGTTRAIC